MTREEEIKAANPYGNSSDVAFGKMVGFEAGAKWADEHPKSPWISVKDRLPEDEECVYVIPQCKLLCWNEYHNVWDDEDGDDYYCDKDAVSHWMPIPEFEE